MDPAQPVRLKKALLATVDRERITRSSGNNRAETTPAAKLCNSPPRSDHDEIAQWVPGRGTYEAICSG